MGYLLKGLTLAIRRFIGTNEISVNNRKYLQEILLSQKFNSTIIDSEWFKFKSISPGEAAVGYGLFYTLYRTLSSIRPDNILEFGLGQSSKMVHQYASYYHKNAVTVEHDSNWVDFFQNSKDGDYPVNIKLLDLEQIQYGGSASLTYKDCLKTFEGQKFDLVIVDGPFGHDFTYSRTQVIDIVKNSVRADFIVIIDDYDRKGEQNTAKELFSYLNSAGIDYVYRKYEGLKNHLLITTPKYKFLTTL